MMVKIAAVWSPVACVAACGGSSQATAYARASRPAPTVSTTPTPKHHASHASADAASGDDGADKRQCDGDGRTGSVNAGTDDPNLVAAVEVGGGPCAMAELDGSVWVTAQVDGTVVRIDGATNRWHKH